ncbi:protein ovarian tumor locus-like [Neodiprion fabricii]|uniref:protein ovarian tumor locus-like n=1 Tax=Neodiprion fabricii TaxID=2872261 RepID=UPI001ED8DA9E|nr:protein ovarian tumor locus-like [Neodiprion fabricii]
MDISPRKPCKRMPEPVDEWLHTEGYFRKHAPRDPTCLFRAISEQVYLTQHFHIKVREECVRYMRDNKNLFEESISIPFESYLEQMSYFTEWGGMLEIKAMSLLYKRDVVMFNGQKLTRQLVTSNGFEKLIYLCHIPPKQYETIYARDFISTAAFCQSIVYQTLYKDVFQMADVDNAVFKMLHERSNNISHDKFFLKENLEIREQLTVELFNKLEKSTEETEESQVVAKSITPFPYRIAKALDPNIYRNTDFDIWHEIRREIRNAGWMKYNSSELQVGGKCLVHMDTKEDELDKTNNNSSYNINLGEKSSKDNNGNDQKSTKKPGKKDSVIFSGHIQEMSKNEGPVVVFIEELGEKKTVPYSSLKPITQKKNKQPNWPLANHKKNPIYETGSQKWKKSWYGNTKKIKDLAINLNSLTTKQTDKNNNKVHEEENTQWENESGHSEDSSSSYKAYAMEALTTYQGYAVNTSIDVMPVSVILDGPRSNIGESLQPGVTKSDNTKNSNPTNNGDKVTSTSEVAEKQISATAPTTITPEIASHGSQNCNRNTQNEVYYPTQGNIAQYLGGSGNIYYPAADCNIIPSPQFYISNGTSYSPPAMDSLRPTAQVNQVLQSVNTSVSKSIEVNGSDLPLSDLATLRFYYNLGVEYYRANCGWIGCGASQAMTCGTCYVSQTNMHSQYNNLMGNHLTANESSTLNEDEVSHITQNLQHKLVISQHQGEQTCSNRDYLPNNGKAHGRAANLNNHGSHKSIVRNDSQSLSENRASPHTILVQQSTPYSPSNEKLKEPSTPNNKDNQRANRNSLAPRFKKNFDGRYRNSRQQQQPSQQQHHHQQQEQTFQHPQSVGNVDLPAAKNICVQNLHSSEGQQISPAHNLVAHTGSNTVYQNPVNQLPFSQPPIYTAVPYYSTDAESTFQNQFYPTNQNFSLPYIPHSDISDGNNVSHFPQSIYPGGENYGQPYPLYSQYMYPTSMYPPIPTQNAPENWYAMPGQTQTMPLPHYVQYSPPPAPVPGSPNGTQSSNLSQ